MSADPNSAADGNTYSPLFAVPITPIYETFGGAQGAELVTTSGLPNDKFMVDRLTVPPYSKDMLPTHPCFEKNAILGRCAAGVPKHYDLATRTTRCSDVRLELMKCLAAQKRLQKRKAGPPSGEA